ncbi:MAG: hypothetical protein FWF09_00690 [Bacteroidales bacterium]|nr:hypothetical protein [Bacteroidales bacterium]
MKTLKPLLIKSFIFSIVLGIITVGLRHTDIAPLIHDQWCYLLIFYFILTGFNFHRLLKSFQKEPRKFFYSFLSISILRMFLFIGIVLVYVFVFHADNTQNAVSFIITFTAYYLLFTTCEVVLIVSAIKNKKHQPH